MRRTEAFARCCTLLGRLGLRRLRHSRPAIRTEFKQVDHSAGTDFPCRWGCPSDAQIDSCAALLGQRLQDNVLGRVGLVLVECSLGPKKAHSCSSLRSPEYLRGSF
ncbi:unnamed protein product [Symbiodinium natans]|uniref:Uncharacterized protein n=1 Tax=Symbiodinium natans TaxID=878477 RepID=A0A812KVR3_9DINO|nr:unnamed protein product [Symbiodinium natans]